MCGWSEPVEAVGLALLVEERRTVLGQAQHERVRVPGSRPEGALPPAAATWLAVVRTRVVGGRIAGGHLGGRGIVARGRRRGFGRDGIIGSGRSEEHTSELQALMRLP